MQQANLKEAICLEFVKPCIPEGDYIATTKHVLLVSGHTVVPSRVPGQIIVLFFSTVFAVFATPYHLCSTPLPPYHPFSTPLQPFSTLSLQFFSTYPILPQLEVFFTLQLHLLCERGVSSNIQ